MCNLKVSMCDTRQMGLSVSDLHAPFEDAQWAACREGRLGVFQPQHTLAAVQGLVNLGMRLHLEALILAGADVHLESRILLVQQLQRKVAEVCKELFAIALTC